MMCRYCKHRYHLLKFLCRTIQEVKMERDSIAFRNLQPFQPAFPLPSSGGAPPEKQPPARRSVNRQIVSMYDPPMPPDHLPPKTMRGASSIQNISLTGQPPAPCIESGQFRPGNTLTSTCTVDEWLCYCGMNVPF